MASAIIGNAATKVYHDGRKRGDSCRTEEIKRSNRRSFASSEEARAAGYEPCKKCRVQSSDDVSDIVNEG